MVRFGFVLPSSHSYLNVPELPEAEATIVTGSLVQITDLEADKSILSESARIKSI